MIFECVLNISEGQSADVIDAIAHNGGASVRDVHMDIDHHRSVITIASHELREVYTSAQNVVHKAYELLTIEDHEGVHPRLGIVDVVPFVSYTRENVLPTQDTIDASLNFGAWANNLFDVPIFFYDYASEDRTTLPFVRKHAFESLEPSLESSHADSAMCVGAREPLVAINVNLSTKDIALARSIARDVRESSGGIKNVRALGLELTKQKMVQVSMNIVDVVKTNVEDVCETIRTIANANEISSEVELVGLIPEIQFSQWSERFRQWSGLNETCTVEHSLAQ